jgi:hypothetical protein
MPISTSVAAVMTGVSTCEQAFPHPPGPHARPTRTRHFSYVNPGCICMPPWDPPRACVPVDVAHCGILSRVVGVRNVLRRTVCPTCDTSTHVCRRCSTGGRARCPSCDIVALKERLDRHPAGRQNRPKSLSPGQVCATAVVHQQKATALDVV